MMRLIVSDPAIADLADILEYIEQDRPSAAQSMRERFWQEFYFLRECPHTGHTRSDVPDRRYRFKCLKSFVICYRVDGSDLRIVRVLHGARDFRQVHFE